MICKILHQHPFAYPAQWNIVMCFPFISCAIFLQGVGEIFLFLRKKIAIRLHFLKSYSFAIDNIELLLVLIIRIILSTYKFFPSSYAFFIISTWSSAVFAASIPPPPTMPFKEAFSKKEVPHHAPLLLLPLHTHLQVYQNCSLLEDLSIWSILFYHN